MYIYIYMYMHVYEKYQTDGKENPIKYNTVK